MSSNKTQNYQLHAWEPNDHVLMTEFNENFAAIDTAIKTERTQADSTANRRLATVQSELSSTITNVKTNLEQSVAGLQTLVEGKTALAAGAYAGNGQESQTIFLGFTPKAVIVASSDGIGPDYGAIALVEAPAISGRYPWLEVATDGFIAYRKADTRYTVNNLGVTYYYLAFA